MAMPQTDAANYYRLRAENFRHQADELIDRPRRAKELRELAALFEKQARELDAVLNPLPVTNTVH